jgi:hypothetical protein
MAERDARRQQVMREIGGALPVTRRDVAHGPRRYAGHDRDLARRGSSDTGGDDPSDRVDAIEAAMQDPCRKLAARPAAPSAEQPHDPDETALRPLAQLPSIAAPTYQTATTPLAGSPARPDHRLHVARMMAPQAPACQTVFGATGTSSPINAAITSGFMPIQTCRQQLRARAFNLLAQG